MCGCNENHTPTFLFPAPQFLMEVKNSGKVWPCLFYISHLTHTNQKQILKFSSPERRTNLMGIRWEVDWNTWRTKKFQNPPTPSPQLKRTLGLLGACCCITSLAQHNFYFYICLSPFWTEDNGLEYMVQPVLFFFCFFWVGGGVQNCNVAQVMMVHK